MWRIGICLLVGTLLFSAVKAGPVSDAAKIGDNAEIERLLALGADVNEADPMALPLHWAAMNGHNATVELLAAHGADLDAPSKLGTPLHAATNFGRSEAVRALLEAGANPNAQDSAGYPPLFRAASNNRTDVIEILISGGADLNFAATAKECNSQAQGLTSALHLAKSQGRKEAAAILIAAGAEPTPPDAPANVASIGDAQRGRELAVLQCKSCHTISANDQPTEDHYAFGRAIPLIGVIGRPVASLQGFDYTEDMVAHGGTWTPERLFSFVLSPMLSVPGTSMDCVARPTPDMVADIIAYLVSEGG